MNLNKLDSKNIQIVTNDVVSDVYYRVPGNEISWLYVQPKDSATFNSLASSHLWASILGIYSQSQANIFSTTRSDGGAFNTMLTKVNEAYNTTGMYVGNISNEAFRTSLYKNLSLKVPISGGTGDLSGLTSLNLYTGFIEQKNSKSADGCGPCATWLVDSLWSESDPRATYEAGIGYAYDPNNNPSPDHTKGQYRSGIVYLFSDSIDWSGATTGVTWDTGFSGSSKYTFNNGRFAQFDGSYNEAVGLVNVDSGLVALWHPDVVNNFNTDIAISGNSVTGLTFNTSDCNAIIKDRDASTELRITVNLEPGTFTPESSTNHSILDAKARGVDCGTQVSITEVCFYNDRNQLMGFGKLDTPLEKRTNDFGVITASLTVDGGVKESPANTRSL